MSDVTIDLSSSTLQTHRNLAEPWSVTLLDTGLEVGTGAVEENIAILGWSFCMTYGDGVSNVDIAKLIDFHKKRDFGSEIALASFPQQNLVCCQLKMIW